MLRTLTVFVMLLVPQLALAFPKGMCEAPPVDAQSTAVVELIFWFAEPDERGFDGYRSSGVFISPTTIATLEHVLPEKETDRAQVMISWSETVDEPVADSDRMELPIAGIRFIATGIDDRIALIDLPAGIIGRTDVGVRYEGLQDREPVFGLAYRDGALRFAYGRHMLPKRSSSPAAGSGESPPLMFELADWEHRVRMVFDHGSSGGPVFDCAGRLVSLMSQAITQTIDIGIGEPMRVSSAWGQPNMIGVHVSQIDE